MKVAILLMKPVYPKDSHTFQTYCFMTSSTISLCFYYWEYQKFRTFPPSCFYLKLGPPNKHVFHKARASYCSSYPTNLHPSIDSILDYTCLLQIWNDCRKAKGLLSSNVVDEMQGLMKSQREDKRGVKVCWKSNIKSQNILFLTPPPE